MPQQCTILASASDHYRASRRKLTNADVDDFVGAGFVLSGPVGYGQVGSGLVVLGLAGLGQMG